LSSVSADSWLNDFGGSAKMHSRKIMKLTGKKILNLEFIIYEVVSSLFVVLDIFYVCNIRAIGLNGNNLLLFLRLSRR
jgi:hypothetical protein